MVALARQIGVIIENHELRQRLKQTAATLERRRLGRDLHDSVTQLLYGMTLFTGSAKEAMEDGDRLRLERSLNNLANAALQALREMRFMLFELQPPVLAEEGLVQALQARLDMVERRVGVQIDFAIDEGLPHEERVDQELYYVAIEALNNAFKHGNARWVGLSIYQEDGCVSLVVADNGQGFDTDLVTPGLGLRSMRQRMENLGGELTIRTALNEGTEIIAKVPL